MFTELDRQLARFGPRLTDDLLLPPATVARVASTIADDLRALGDLRAVLDDQDTVDFDARYEELVAFQGFMEASQTLRASPVVTRAQVVIQNYICFVYLKETWLERLRRAAPPESALSRCTAFLTTGRVRAFRNAVSHARWRYRSDFTGIDYWDRASADRSAPVQAFSVDQLELDFWQGLTRGVSYVAAELRRVEQPGR